MLTLNESLNFVPAAGFSTGVATAIGFAGDPVLGGAVHGPGSDPKPSQEPRNRVDTTALKPAASAAPIAPNNPARKFIAGLLNPASRWTLTPARRLRATP